MANLYSLSAAFMACERLNDEEVVNTTTGEVLNIAYLDNLEMERNEKLEACACYVKNITADIVAFDAEIARLTEAKRLMKNKVERMKKYIADNMTKGEKLTTPKCSLSWRKSEVLELADDIDLTTLPAEALKVKELEVDKTVLKKMVKEGAVISGVSLVERNNLQIK